jgi:hypothetical protein
LAPTQWNSEEKTRTLLYEYYSPQSRPKTPSFPPLTAVSTASASFLNAITSSSNSGDTLVPLGSLSCSTLTPRARCSASSRSGPRNVSIDVRRPQRLGWDPRTCRIADDVADRCINRQTVSYGQSQQKSRKIEPIASYSDSCRGLGSSRFSGSGYADSSGTYGHLNDVKERRGCDSRISSSIVRGGIETIPGINLSGLKKETKC